MAWAPGLELDWVEESEVELVVGWAKLSAVASDLNLDQEKALAKEEMSALG